MAQYEILNGAAGAEIRAGINANFLELYSAVALASPLNSPVFTGTPAGPTASAGTNTTQLATTAFVRGEIAALVASSPGTLDTLNELAGALGNDPAFATTITTLIGTKAPLASPALTGTPTAPTAGAGTNTTQLATTAFVAASFAPINAPTFTGVPAAPTAAGGTSTTQIATTAFVAAGFQPLAAALSALAAGSAFVQFTGPTTSTRVFTLPDASATILTSLSKADTLQAGEFAADAGASDTYAATLSPAITAYTTGVMYRFKANTANTGAATINFNGLGAKTIVKVTGGITTALADNDIQAGQWVNLVYDGTNMQMVSQLGNAGGSTGDVTLGAASGGNITISGTTANHLIIQAPTGNKNLLLNASTDQTTGAGAIIISGGATGVGLNTILAVRRTGESTNTMSVENTGMQLRTGNLDFRDAAFTLGNQNNGTGFYLSVAAGLNLANSKIITFCGSTNAAISPDVGLARVGAAVLKITNASTGGGIIEFPQVSAGGTVTADCARIYSKDVSGTAEIFVKDEAGNETQISPHAGDAPDELYDEDEPFPHVTRESNDYLGLVRYVNLTRQRAGRPNWEFRETFEEHNKRLGLTGDSALIKLDWDTVQAEAAAKREEERAEWARQKEASDKAAKEWEVAHEKARVEHVGRVQEWLKRKELIHKRKKSKIGIVKEAARKAARAAGIPLIEEPQIEEAGEMPLISIPEKPAIFFDPEPIAISVKAKPRFLTRA